MNRILSFTYCFIATLFVFNAKLFASPGDTTWVQAQNNINLDYYNNFDAVAAFPSGSTTYRKIIMVFTLGKYECAAGTQYCGDWDYTIQNFLVPPTGNQIELGRLISPYANSAAPRTPLSWKQRYYYDVTDYASSLKNSATVRINYQGYSGGFTASIRFAFIEGTPPRNVVGVTKLWDGSFNYGDPSSSIETNLTVQSLTAPAGTASADMKFVITGHGSDGTGCSEFCSKYYNVLQNGSQIDQKQIWKDNCGQNDLYPQSGTWLYDRANWCPGQLITPFTHKFNSIVAGTAFTADVDLQAYTRSGSGTPSYTVSGYMIYYGNYNRSIDASLEQIIAPTSYEGNFKSNPSCGTPQVKVKNQGSTTITSISFQYGLTGQTPITYTATGLSLASNAETVIILPVLPTLMTIAGTNEITVTITSVNGSTDQETLNNTLKEPFIVAPDWPSSFYIKQRTNNFYNETTWKIFDMNNTIVKSGTNPAAALTFYSDLVGPLSSGCYKLVVTDNGCNGMYWWANSGSTGLGAIFAQNAAQTAIIPFTNGLPAVIQSGSNISVPNYSQDFGCGFTQYFRIGAIVPLTLLKFTGKADADSKNHLYWQTTEEVNTSYFDVEFSTDGMNFNKAATVAAKGNTTTASDYSTTHLPALKADKYYYRLKMVDKDGSFRYSETIVLKPSAGSFEVQQVKPNPFTSEVQVVITATKSKELQINLLDVHGRLIKTQKGNIVQGSNSITVNNLSNLSKGIYYLEIISQDNRSVQKIIKE